MKSVMPLSQPNFSSPNRVPPYQNDSKLSLNNLLNSYSYTTPPIHSTLYSNTHIQTYHSLFSTHTPYLSLLKIPTCKPSYINNYTYIELSHTVTTSPKTQKQIQKTKSQKRNGQKCNGQKRNGQSSLHNAKLLGHVAYVESLKYATNSQAMILQHIKEDTPELIAAEDPAFQISMMIPSLYCWHTS